jgi:uncharacterized protein (TIGR00251 family)
MKRGTLIIEIKVIPGARRKAFDGCIDGRLKIRVPAPPEKGKANKALVAFVAKAFDIRKSDVTIVKGERSREKTLSLSGNPVELKTRYESIRDLKH